MKLVFPFGVRTALCVPEKNLTSQAQAFWRGRLDRSQNPSQSRNHAAVSLDPDESGGWGPKSHECVAMMSLDSKTPEDAETLFGPWPHGSKPMLPFWGFRCTTRFGTYFIGEIGMFTGGTISVLTHGHVLFRPLYILGLGMVNLKTSTHI